MAGKLYAMTEADWRIWQRMKARFQREPALGIGSYESKKRLDWKVYLAVATEGASAGGQGKFKFVDGKPDDPGDEESSEQTEYDFYARTTETREGDIFHVGFVLGNWERIGGGSGTTIYRGILLDDLTATNVVTAALTSSSDPADFFDTGDTLDPVYSGLPSISVIYAGTVVYMIKEGGGYTVFAHDCPDSTGSLEFTVQPTNVVHGSGTITPAVKVQVLDGLGNLLTGSSVSVTLAVKGADAMLVSGQRLSGTLTRTPTAGIVTFDDIRVVQAQNNIHLQARAINFGSVTSDSINST